MAIAGCSRAPNKVFIQPQALYKTLGFNDKNDDGVIEKKSIGTLWRDEGYKPEADINGDGKIVETEAKYFLQNQSNIKPNITRAFSLTNEDCIIIVDLFKEKLSSIRSMKEIDSRGKIDRGKAFIKVNAIIGLSELVAPVLGEETIKQIFKEFHKTALSFICPQAQGRALEALVNAACELGLIDNAIYIANTIKNSGIQPQEKGSALSHISKSLAEAGSYKKALMIARDIKDDTFNKDRALRDIAGIMVERRFSADDITSLFKTNGINIKIRNDDSLHFIFE